MRALACGLLAFLVAVPARADLPEFYRRVTSLHWIVRDLDTVTGGWARLGLPAVTDFGEVTLAPRIGGESTSLAVRIAQARFGELDVFWIQPVGDGGPLAAFLDRHGEGVLSINHQAPSRAALDAEVARLEGLGVGVLARTEVDTGEGTLTVVHMDTVGRGKYVLGLTAGEAPAPARTPPPMPFDSSLAQYALVVRDTKAVSDYWEELGFPAMDVTHPALTDLRYRGEPGRFDQELGWHRHGTVTWEWITPLEGPTVYQDFLDAHGEGVHHLALDVSDIDAVAAAWTTLGFPIVQSGGWGEKGKPGSGRFAYADTTPIGGVTIELLWNQP